jgi:hypothetical protein
MHLVFFGKSGVTETEQVELFAGRLVSPANLEVDPKLTDY